MLLYGNRWSCIHVLILTKRLVLTFMLQWYVYVIYVYMWHTVTGGAKVSCGGLGKGVPQGSGVGSTAGSHLPQAMCYMCMCHIFVYVLYVYMCHVCVTYVYVCHMFSYCLRTNTKYVFPPRNTIHFTNFYFQYWFLKIPHGKNYAFSIKYEINYKQYNTMCCCDVEITRLFKSTPCFSFRNLTDNQIWNCASIRVDVSNWTGFWGRRVSKICEKLKNHWSWYYV